MKNLNEHYIGKNGHFEGGRVNYSDDHYDVFCKDGKHQVALRKNGAGQWVDESAGHGCASKHDLAPSRKQVEAHIARGVFHPKPQDDGQHFDAHSSWGIRPRPESAKPVDVADLVRVAVESALTAKASAEAASKQRDQRAASGQPV